MKPILFWWDTNTSDTAAANIVQAAQVLAEALFASSAAMPGSELLASIAVNATLASSLWTCISSPGGGDHERPVTLYSDNRMPTILLIKLYVVADLADTKRDDAFKVNLYPNACETFTRTFQASAL
ncbi:hypothetical protein DYB25_000868 [Aphanomyces astaci]|uniref:Uncharacterized protein n=1 Tax=Aphanomyces astaci TaxID=112090 RepID=A0A397B3N2_APHAT|nr:hypothetical protein DYB25_000868 [Aphanomyces astaci]